ncbi:MAG: hypothetical protein SF123_03330 [Chloroflexota bacterium]|nr:hypothetical protein [Chloroflexota bacterium]
MNSLLGKTLAGALGILLLSSGIAAAQETIDPALLTPVETALESTRALDSLRIHTQSLTETSAEFGDVSIQTESEMNLVRTEADWNAAGTIGVIGELPVIGTLDISGEVVLIEGTTYVRFGDLPDGLPIELPQTWTTTDTLETSGGFIPLPTTADGLLGVLNLPITAETVTAIAALPQDEIDGQTMTVTQVSLDPAAVLESDAASLVTVAGPGAGGNVPGGLTPPDGQQLPEEITPPEPEDIQVTLAIYVGAEDGYVHRIYLLVNVVESEDGTRAGGTITTLSDYSNFDEPVEITAPIVGS